MIITIDGRSGAGKSTQARIIAKKYGLVCRNFSHFTREVCDVYWKEVGRNKFHPNIMLPGLLEYSTAVRADRRKIVIDESLFHPFCQNQSVTGFDRWNEYNWYFDFLSTYRLTPHHSFYFLLDYETAQKRRRMRGESVHMDAKVREKEEVYFRYWQEMERRIPFLHLIDASQPVEKVTSDILEWI